MTAPTGALQELCKVDGRYSLPDMDNGKLRRRLRQQVVDELKDLAQWMVGGIPAFGSQAVDPTDLVGVVAAHGKVLQR